MVSTWRSRSDGGANDHRLTSVDWLKNGKVYEAPTPTVEQLTAAKDVLNPLFDAAIETLAAAFPGKVRDDLDATKPEDVYLVCKVCDIKLSYVLKHLATIARSLCYDVLLKQNTNGLPQHFGGVFCWRAETTSDVVPDNPHLVRVIICTLRWSEKLFVHVRRGTETVRGGGHFFCAFTQTVVILQPRSITMPQPRL